MDWLGKLTFIDFLGTGEAFSVNVMLPGIWSGSAETDHACSSRNSRMLVRCMISAERGIWLPSTGERSVGNIVADGLTRRVRNAEISPMRRQTKADGTSFASRIGQCVADAGRTAAFYQFWLNQAMRTRRYSSTSPSFPEICRMRQIAGSARRAAQQRLASEVTRMIHGDKRAND